MANQSSVSVLSLRRFMGPSLTAQENFPKSESARELQLLQPGPEQTADTCRPSQTRRQWPFRLWEKLARYVLKQERMAKDVETIVQRRIRSRLADEPIHVLLIDMTDPSAPPEPESTPEPSLASEELYEAITPVSVGGDSIMPSDEALASPSDLRDLQAQLQETLRRRIFSVPFSSSCSPPHTLPSLSASPHPTKTIMPLTLEDPQRDRDLMILRTAVRMNGTLKVSHLSVRLSALSQHAPFLRTMHRGSLLLWHHPSLSGEKLRDVARRITAGGGEVTEPLARWGVEGLAGDKGQLVLLGEKKKEEEQDEAEKTRKEKGKAVALDNDPEDIDNDNHRLNRFER